MGRRRCCCECWNVQDNFNRDDSTNIGGVLIEKHGDSEIRSNELWMPGGGTPAATVYTAAPHIKRAYSGIVTAKAVETVENGKYRLLINYDPVADQGHWIQLEQTAADQIITLDTGDTWTHVGRAPGTDVNLRLCYTGLTNGRLDGDSGTQVIWDRATPYADGWHAGLVNAGTPDILFDDFKFEEHYETNTDCPCCGCTCNGIMPPKSDLTATITANGCLSAMNGGSGLLHWDAVNRQWSGVVDSGGCSCCSTMFLRCFTGPCTGKAGWEISQAPDLVECAPGSTTYPDLTYQPNWVAWDPLAASTCDPFSLVFGPGDQASYFAGCCTDIDAYGEWWVTITE